MADDPIVEPPFDSGLDSALRYKCPGINSRNSFTSHVTTIRCAMSIKSAPVVLQVDRYHSSCNKAAPFEYPEGYFTMHKICNNQLRVSQQQVIPRGVHHTTLSCRRYIPFVFDGTGFKAKCQVRAKSNYNRVTGILPLICKWKKAPENRVVRHACRNSHLRSNVPPTTRIQHYCMRLSPNNRSGQPLCRNYPYYIFPTSPDFFRGNTISCRPSEILDYTTYIFNPICKVDLLTPNLPIQFGIEAYRASTIQCRITEVFVQQFDGDRWRCTNNSRVVSTPMTYKINRTGINCKIFHVEDRPGKIFKCGSRVDGNAPALIFGRLWGGRDPFPPSVRLSGRMYGRIRPD